MRSLLLAVVVLAWLFLGWLYYDSQKSCCAQSSTDNIGNLDDSNSAKSTEGSITGDSKPVKANGPILFNYENKKAEFSSDWNNYKDKLVASLKENETLQITGRFSEDEKAPPGYENMGLARADETRKALGLEVDRVQMRAVLQDKGIDKDNPYEAVTFRNIIVNKSIDETIENRTIIRFPSNSTNKLDDKVVENYLDKLAVRVKKSGEKVRLTGYSDSDGSEAANQQLGQRRADVIMKYLVSKGVSKENIITLSKGESDPVASNETSAGKAQNRRTELEIIE